MSNDFETRVYPVIKEWAGNVFKDDEQAAQDAIGLCWYRYQHNPRSKDLHEKMLAWMAIRHVRSGRRLPGERARGEDALDRAFFHGAGMGEVQDKSPGPDKLAVMKEEWNALLSKLTVRQMELLELAHLELTTSELAEMFAVSRARVSQLRREIMERSQE